MTESNRRYTEFSLKMISLKKCREILDPKHEKYTDHQLMLIKNHLIKIAEINLMLFEESRLTQQKSNDEESSHNV